MFLWVVLLVFLKSILRFKVWKMEGGYGENWCNGSSNKIREWRIFRMFFDFIQWYVMFCLMS